MDEEKHKLAHDLRNALSGIYMQAQMLEMLLGDSDHEKEKKLAHELQTGIESAIQIITSRLQ